MRRGERITGILASLLGVLGLGYALFGPVISFTRMTEASSAGGSVTTTGTTSLFATQGVPPFFIIMLVLMIGVAATAVWDARRDRQPALALLWALSLLILGGCLLSMFSLSSLLLPAALCALLAALLGTVRRLVDGTTLRSQT